MVRCVTEARLRYKGIVLLLIATVAFSASCATEARLRGKNREKLKLMNTLNQISYWPRTYQKNIFDCSNMLALLYDALEQKGYHCEIFMGQTLTQLLGGKSGHTWLVTHKNGHKFWVDPVVKSILPSRFFWKYIFRERFDSLEELKRKWKEKELDMKEWEY
jgi:hypothetical protein